MSSQKERLKTQAVVSTLKIPTTYCFLFLAFFFSSFAILSFFLSTAPSGVSNSYSLATFDLFYSVHWIAWVAVFGLGGLLIALLLREFKDLSGKFSFILMCVLLLAIFLIFFALPYVVEPVPRYWDTWIHGSGVQSILDTGHLTTADLNYLNYPASFIFLSIITTLTGLSLTSVLYVLPIALVILFFLFMIYSFYQIIGNPRIVIVATLIYGLSTYYLIFSLTPAIFGWLLFFLFIALLAKQIYAYGQLPSPNLRSFFILIILVLLTIGMTHPVTQAITLLTTLLVSIFLQKFLQHRKISIVFVLLVAIVFASWAILFGSQYYSGILKNFDSTLSAATSSLSNSKPATLLSSGVPSEISNLILYRRALYIIVIVTSILGFLTYRKKRSSTTILLLAMTVSGLLLGSLTLFGALPIERSIQLAFIPLSIFSAVLLLKNKKIGAILIVFLVATIPLNFAGYYWDEPFSQTHNWEISSAQFIAQNFHGDVLSDYKEHLLMTYYNGSFRTVHAGVSQGGYGGAVNIYNATYIHEYSIQLVYVSQLAMLKASYSGLQTSGNFTESLNFDCILSTGNSMVFLDPSYPNYTTVAK